MNHYDEQLHRLLEQCARKKKLEASAAELTSQRNVYIDRVRELEQYMQEEQEDVDQLEAQPGRLLLQRGREDG